MPKVITVGALDGETVRRLKQAGDWPAGEPLVLPLVPIPSAQTAGGAAEGIRLTKVTPNKGCPQSTIA